MLTSPKYIRSVLEANGFHFSKAKGQNFLIDPSVPERIASYTDESMGVLEVGPGFGALTQALCARAGRVVALELDRKLMPVLRQNLHGLERLTLLEGDALREDLDALAAGYFRGLAPTVAANIPYSITSPLLTKLIESPSYRQMIVMVQSEVARRICSEPGLKTYGAFTVFCRVYCEAEILFDVPPECFMPRPAVDSSVIRLTRREEPLVPEALSKTFFRVVRGAFAQRRKTMKNAMSSAFAADGPEIADILSRAGCDPALRGEVLDIDLFLKITKELEKRVCGCHDGV